MSRGKQINRLNLSSLRAVVHDIYMIEIVLIGLERSASVKVNMD